MDISFSFIIPHKNTPKLLERCLRSIPDREDLEIIVIDDGSDVTLMPQVAAYSNVRLLKNSISRGAGFARNVGLHHARGKWVIFADSDDFFNYCVGDCISEYFCSDADIVFFRANSVDGKSYVNASRAVQLNRFVDVYKGNVSKGAKLLRYKFGEPWSKMIKMDLIRRYSILFDEVEVHNDTMFSLLVGFHAASIMVDNRAIYCCTVRQGSLSYSDSIAKLLVRVDVFSRAERFLKANLVTNVWVFKHFVALIYLLVLDRSAFIKGYKKMRENNNSFFGVVLRIFISIPLFLADLNKVWVKRFIYK
ncbi:glycosyltransferase family 2 protein [Geofilum rhodophaeum]|uniref:glycosyltransferase family 2 protein n=1 Tax=Geofilum rhodophaeum TaxID=1965019 RepID=UPI000B5210DB|nr:glycosyltransferase family 2 protein [Geofilum rhodophaeum]